MRPIYHISPDHRDRSLFRVFRQGAYHASLTGMTLAGALEWCVTRARAIYVHRTDGTVSSKWTLTE